MQERLYQNAEVYAYGAVHYHDVMAQVDHIHGVVRVGGGDNWPYFHPVDVIHSIQIYQDLPDGDSHPGREATVTWGTWGQDQPTEENTNVNVLDRGWIREYLPQPSDDRMQVIDYPPHMYQRLVFHEDAEAMTA